MKLTSLLWYIKQLLPLAYWSWYIDADGTLYLCIWRMWFGRHFDVLDLPIGAAVRARYPERSLNLEYLYHSTEPLSMRERRTRYSRGERL